MQKLVHSAVAKIFKNQTPAGIAPQAFGRGAIDSVAVGEVLG